MKVNLMNYQEQIDKWKAANVTEARNLFGLSANSENLTWRFTKPDQKISPDFIDINKYYDHYNIQTPLIKVDLLHDTSMKDGILDKTWQSLQEGNCNNFIRSVTIEDTGFKTMRLQLIDRTFSTVQVLLERAIAKGSGNTIEDNYKNDKKTVAKNEPQEGELVSLEVLKQPNGVTNNIRINYGWSVDDGACGGYFENLSKAGIRYGNETTNYRWNSRTYANYDPLIRNDGIAPTLAAEENSNKEEFSHNLSSQKILAEYNLQTTAWNGWEEFYITDIKSTLTETGIIYDITATGADNMKLNGYKMVQMYAELTAKPKEVLTCLMNNFNGRKENVIDNAKKGAKPFYLLWVDDQFPELQEEKKVILMRNGKLFDPSTIQDEEEKKKAEAESKWSSMSEEQMESYATDSKTRAANIGTRLEVLKKALGCITGKSGGEGDESYVAGDVKSIQKKFPGYNKDDFKPGKIDGTENIHGESAAYYYLAALNEGIIPKNAPLYQSSAFFKYLEENLVNFSSSFSGFKTLSNGEVLTNGTVRGNNFKRENILSVMPRAFFDDLYKNNEYYNVAHSVNENFGNQITLTLMSEAMLTLMDDFIETMKYSIRKIEVSRIIETDSEVTEQPSTSYSGNYLEIPLNVALLLCPTYSSLSYQYFGEQKVGEKEYSNVLKTRPVSDFDATSARTKLVEYFKNIAGWISNYGSDKKGKFNGIYRAENHSSKPAEAIFGTGMTPMRITNYYLNKSESEADKKYEELKKKIKIKWQDVFDDGSAYGGNINGEKEETSVFFIAMCLLVVVSTLQNGLIPGVSDGKDGFKANHLSTLQEFKDLWEQITTVNENNPIVLWNGNKIIDTRNISENFSTIYTDTYGVSVSNYKFKSKGFGNSEFENHNLNSSFVDAYKSRCEYVGGTGSYGSGKEDWSNLPLKEQLSKTWGVFRGMNSADKILLDFMEAEDFPGNQPGATGSYGGTNVNYKKSNTDKGSKKDSYFQELIKDGIERDSTARKNLAIEITKDIKTLTKNQQDLNKTIATLEAGKLNNQITLTLGTVDSVGKIKYKSISSLLNEFCSQCKPFHDYEQEVSNKNKQKAASSAKDAEVSTQAKYVDAEGNEQVADLEAEAPTYPLSWEVVGYIYGAPIVGLFYKKPFKFHKIRKYCWGTGNKEATAVKALSISSASEFAMLSSAQRTTVSFDDAGRAVGILKKGYGTPVSEEETSSKAETYLSVKDFADSPLIVRNVANEDDLKRISTVMLQAVNKGSITVLGDPSLRFSGVVSPYTLPIYIDVSLQKEGQSWGSNQDLGIKSTLSGVYVVGKITHQINSSGYTTTLEVMRYPGITKSVLGISN